MGFVLAAGLAVVSVPATQDGHRSGRVTDLAALAVDVSALADTTFTFDDPAVTDHACSSALPWVAKPRIAPVEGWFSDGFKWRRDPVHGGRRFHNGIDIVAPIGTVVRAPADGVVIRAARNGGYGNMIELDHLFGHRTRFAHLDSFDVREGQTVRMGDVIGRVGLTGKTIGPHLHYEVFNGTRRVNPWRYLGPRETPTIALPAS